MVFSCFRPNIAILRWITYIKSINPKFKHILQKDNALVDMLWGLRHCSEEEMIDSEEDMITNFYSTIIARRESLNLIIWLELFLEELYECLWICIGKYLYPLDKEEDWMDQKFKKIERKVYDYFLHDGFLWKHTKQKDGVQQRIVSGIENQQKIFKKCLETW